MTKKTTTTKKAHDLVLKVIIIGDSGVGKTNLLTRYCEGIFKESYVATIGVDFKIKLTQHQDKKVKLQIWDTAGQERFKNITQTYYKGAAGIILVYAINNLDSFRNLNSWIRQIQNTSNEDATVILIGAKSDLSYDRQVPTQEAQKLAMKHKFLFLQVSAKSGENINDAFTKLTSQMMEKRLQKVPSTLMTSGLSILSKQKIEQKQNCAC